MTDTAVPVTWRRHIRARRVTLRIDARSAGVVVTLPPRAARAQGIALLQQHESWVRDRLAALPAMAGFADGAACLLDGVEHVITWVEGPGRVWLEGDCLMVGGDPACLARRVADFLRAEARGRFSSLALAKAAQAGVVVSGVSVRDTRSRWGSCSPHGRLMFCWRVLMAPPWVQDYVVAHEVAHLRHLDHGPAFWALAEALSPHRAAAEAWLAQEGPRLMRVA